MQPDPRQRPRQPSPPEGDAPARHRAPRRGLRPAAAIGIVAVFGLVGLGVGVLQGMLTRDAKPSVPATSSTVQQPIADHSP